VDGDDDEGEFDPLPDDDEDAVGREPMSYSRFSSIDGITQEYFKEAHVYVL
jgi:hypothetical protein